MANQDIYDVVVVGRGMIGSAAARHLAETATSVALIGPGAPDDRFSGQGPFSSHSDEGRITRVFGRTPIWAALAARSIARYRDIEARSGIDFYTNSGVVVASAQASDWITSAIDLDFEASVVTAEWLRSNTGICAPEGVQIAYETAPGGHINPKRMVAAQSRLTEMAGGDVIDGAVTAIGRTDNGWRVSGSWGQVSGRQVLMSTGTYGAELVGRDLELQRRPRTVLMAEVDNSVAVPALISASHDSRLNEIYWVPPVQYPDGRLCIKIGGDLVNTPSLAPHQFADWFNSNGSDEEADALETCLRSLLPEVDFLSFKHMPCVITGTPSQYPYIGWIDDHIAVAVAGNGASAKSSDELGRLAASLFTDLGWASDIDAGEFAPKFA